MTDTSPFPRGRKFGDDAEHDSWDQDEGMPTLSYAGNAIQVWAILQNRPIVTVREAAEAFNLDDAQVREAVNDHSWMYLQGPDDEPTRQTIEHDGE